MSGRRIRRSPDSDARAILLAVASTAEPRRLLLDAHAKGKEVACRPSSADQHVADGLPVASRYPSPDVASARVLLEQVLPQLLRTGKLDARRVDCNLSARAADVLGTHEMDAMVS